MPTTISATELAKNLSDGLNRIHYRGEQFTVERNGVPIANLGPATGVLRITRREVIARVGDLTPPGDDFARDREAIQAAQPPAETTAWPS